MSIEVDQLIKQSRESRKQFVEAHLSYLEHNSKNIKQIVKWYVDIVNDSKQVVAVLAQLADRYKELSRSVNFLTWALLFMFGIIFRDLLYQILIVPFHLVQYVFKLYQQAGAGAQLAFLQVPLFTAIGFFVRGRLSKKK